MRKWSMVPILALVVAFGFPVKAEAQNHYESASDSYSIGNNKLGAGLDIFAEFKHTQNIVRARGTLDGWAKFFGNQVTLLEGEVLSEVDNGASSNKAYMKLFGFTLVNLDDPVQWQWNESWTPQSSQLNYSFPLYWGLSVDIGCELKSGIYANMKIGVASVVGAGLDGKVGPKVQVEIYAALTASLAIVKAQVALTANFTLFDYSLNIEATISPYGVNAIVFVKFVPLSVTVELVLRAKFRKYGLFGPWKSWKNYASWTLWSWSLASVDVTILTWSQNWWVPQKFPVLEAQAKKKPGTKSKSMKKIKMKKMSKRWKKYAM